MNWTQRGVLLLLACLAPIAMAQTSTPSTTVDCDHGQSLNAALAKLNKNTPNLVSVSGTCTEYVQVIGFNSLTLKSTSGATLLQPTSAASNLFTTLLLIESSRSVTVDGFNIQADTTVSAVGIGHGSSDIRLRNLNIQGGGEGIIVFENSQVSIAYVTAQDPGYATLGVYDLSDVHLERSVFKDTTGASFHVGLAVGASHITMYGTTISNMQVGISEGQDSIVDVLFYNTYYASGGSTDVTIVNPAGTNNDGVEIDAGGSLNVVGARLVINNAGQNYGGTSGGIYLSGGGTLTASNGDLVITGSHGQGIVALNNSHATLTGATVTGGNHGGLVVGNMSSIDVASGPTPTLIGGNSVDLFCDPGSTITGSANLSGAPIAQCTNLLATETVALP